MKAKAMRQVKKYMQNFKYIYKKELLEIDLWHFTFQMDAGLPEIQMTIEFDEGFLDVLAFPHPIIANDNNLYNLLRTINNINWNLKSLGRLYIDDYSDLAYSLRIKYNVLEKIGERLLEEVEFSIDIYYDLLKIIFDVSQDKISYEAAKNEIDLIWRKRY